MKLDILSIEKKIVTFLNVQGEMTPSHRVKVEIIDDSEKHKNHAAMLEIKSDNNMQSIAQNVPTHLRIKVIHPIFEGMTRVEKHKMMNELLKEEHSVIHSISFTLLPAEVALQ